MYTQVASSPFHRLPLQKNTWYLVYWYLRCGCLALCPSVFLHCKIYKAWWSLRLHNLNPYHPRRTLLSPPYNVFSSLCPRITHTVVVRRRGNPTTHTQHRLTPATADGPTTRAIIIQAMVTGRVKLVMILQDTQFTTRYGFINAPWDSFVDESLSLHVHIPYSIKAEEIGSLTCFAAGQWVVVRFTSSRPIPSTPVPPLSSPKAEEPPYSPATLNMAAQHWNEMKWYKRLPPPTHNFFVDASCIFPRYLSSFSRDVMGERPSAEMFDIKWFNILWNA